MRGPLTPIVLLGLALGCGRATPPEQSPLDWHDHTGPDEAYAVRFPAPPEKVTTSFGYDDPRLPALGRQTARGTTYRATVNRVTYKLTEYEGAPDLLGPLCDHLSGNRPGAVRDVAADTDRHGAWQKTTEIETAGPAGRVTLRHTRTPG